MRSFPNLSLPKGFDHSRFCIASAQRLGTMGDLQVMSASMDSDPDIALFREDLVILKRDVASLIEHIKGGATNKVQNATNQVERHVRRPPSKSGGAR